MSDQNFNPAAEFLLDMNWANLFEQVGRGDMFHCKGCDAMLPRHERERHFKKHKGIRSRQETMRKKRIARERAARMARVRAARRQEAC